MSAKSLAFRSSVCALMLCCADGVRAQIALPLGSEPHHPIELAAPKSEHWDLLFEAIRLHEAAANNESLDQDAKIRAAVFLDTHPELPIQDFIRDSSFYSFLSDQNPDGFKQTVLQFLIEVAKSADAVAHVVDSNKLDTWNEVSLALTGSSKAQNTRALEILQSSFLTLASHLKKSPAEESSRFLAQKTSMLIRYEALVEAIANRWNTALPRAEDFSTSVNRFVQGGKLSESTRRQDALILSKFLEDEKNQSLVRFVYMDRQLVRAGATSALLAIEGACTVATLGICAGSIPATIAMSARVVLAADSAVSLADTIRLQGASGLVSLSSALDILTIFAVLPTPSARVMKWNPKNAALGFAPVLINNLVQSQHQARLLLAALGPTYGAWQISHAQALSQKLSLAGRSVTAQEIVNQGLVNIALGVLGGLTGYRDFQKLSKISPEYAAALEKVKFGIRTPSLEGVKTSVLKATGVTPVKNIFDVAAKFSASSSKFSDLGQIGKNLGTLGIDVLFWSEAVLFSQTYLDSKFLARAGSVPPLLSREKAVLLNGFNENDLLYFAFNSAVTQSREREAYVFEKDFFAVDFSSPEDFVDKIIEASGARVDGTVDHPIKYLKIATHGIPGHLKTLKAEKDPAHGFIDAAFLKTLPEEKKRLLALAMAPNAKIILVSCLVGANLKQSMVDDFEGYKIDYGTHPGDDFIHELGFALLKKGGTIHSSRRIIMAVESSIGTLVRSMVLDGIRDTQSKEIVMREIQEIGNELAEEQKSVISDAAPETEGERRFHAVGMARYTARRMLRLYSRIWGLTYRYGFNIEGGFASDRYREDSFVDGGVPALVK